MTPPDEAQSFKLEIRGQGDPRGAEVGNKADLPPDLETDLQGAIASDPETRFVRVHRYKVDGTRPFIATVPADGFSLDTIREAWGGGSYQVFLLNTMKRVRHQGRVDVDGAPKSEQTLAPPGALGPETEIARALRELRDIVAAIKNPPPAAATADPIASAISLMTAIQEANKPLMQAVLNGKGEGQTELFLRALKMGLKMAGERGRPDPLERLLDDFALPLLGKINSAGVPREAGVPVAAPAQTEPGEPPPPALPSGPPWAAMFAPYIGRLCNLASLNRNPGNWAGVIADELTDEQADELYRLTTMPEFRSEFFTLFPDAANHRVWFDELITELAAALEPEAPAKKKPARKSATKAGATKG